MTRQVEIHPLPEPEAFVILIEEGKQVRVPVSIKANYNNRTQRKVVFVMEFSYDDLYEVMQEQGNRT